MAEYDNEKWQRPLPFPLLDNEYPEYTESNDGVVTKTTPDFFNPDEPDEIIDIQFRMSMSQFTAIASAIDVGRDIAFGERSYELWRTWCKALIGEIVVNCEQVADCIESEISAGNITLINSLTQNAINNGFGNVNRVNPYLTKFIDRNAPDALQTDVKELLNCDRNKLWGGIRHGIVDRLDEVLADTLQDVAAIPTIIGRNAAWLDIIPVLGDLAEAVVTSLSNVAPTLLSLYESYSSEATKDELACELFALVCADCRYPTFEEIYNHFKNYGMPETPEIGAWVLDTMTQLLTNPVGVLAKVAYFTLMTWQLGILYLQATFNGNTGTNAIFRFASLGEDFSNDNWLLLCETCDDSYVLWTWDFRTQGQGDFYQDTVQTSGQGVFETGKGWRCVNFSTGRRFVVAFQFDPAWKIHAVAMLVDGDTGNSWQWTRRPTWGNTSGQQASSAGVAVLPEWTRAWEGYGGLIDGVNEVYFYTQWTGQTAVAHLAKVSFLFSVGYAPSANGVPTNDITPYTSP